MKTQLRRAEYLIDGYKVKVIVQRNRDKKSDVAQPPLLLLNGIGTTSDVLIPLMQTFSDREVIAFDIPRAKRLGVWRMHGYAEFTRKLLDTLRYPIVDILGYSWGGALAQEFVRRNPARCNKLVLAATSPGHLMVPGRIFFSLKSINPKTLWSPQALLKSAMGSSAAQNGHTEATNISTVIVDSLKPTTYIQQYMALLGWSSLPWLHKIRSKTLIMHARDDQLVSSVNSRVLSWLIPQSSLMIAETGGHAFLFRGNSILSTAVKKFLAA